MVDLGCGSGELTWELARRWPRARVTGIDNSGEMLARARAGDAARGAGPAGTGAAVEFVEADIADLGAWRATPPFDVVLSNAALQWVPDHDRLILGLASKVAPGGILAVQMPGNFDSPSHQAIREAAREPRWRDLLSELGRAGDPVRPLPWYVETLRALDCAVDAWETTYLHLLRGDRPVLEWIRGTALRPLLARIPPAEHAEFLDSLQRRLKEAYPPSGDFTIFPFRRLFFVAHRTA